jgi:hypothetical protein
MSVQDKALIRELKKMAQKNGISPFGHMQIADIKGIAESTWKNKLGSKNSVVDFNCLVKIYKKINGGATLQIYKKLLSFLKEEIDVKANVEIAKKEAEIIRIKTTRDACKFVCTSDFVLISITSLENLQEIIATLLNPKSDTKAINLSLNQELLFDAINTIESYAYSDDGNFSDVLTVKLFVPTYTIFADIMAGTIDGEFLGLIQDEDSVFVQMSDIGKSLVRCEIETQLHQKPVWDELPKSPELRLLTKLQRDGVDVSDSVIDIVTDRYEKTTPYIKGNVFQRLLEIDADLPTDFVKFANDNALASPL